MTTVNIAHLSHGEVDANPEVTWREYLQVIEGGMAGHERTLQTRIGPSEIGTPCTRCLVHKLAEHQEERHPADEWLPTVGTAVHTWLAEHFITANRDYEAGNVRYLVESRVGIGQVGGVEITGSADLFDLHTGEVTDWKVVGDSKIKSAKANGPGQQYRVQAHCYGYGFARRGATVNRVRIAFLPRNATNLRNAYVWTERYDEALAVDAVNRADQIARAINTVGVDAVLSAAPPHTGDFSCNRMPDADVWSKLTHPSPGGTKSPAPAATAV